MPFQRFNVGSAKAFRKKKRGFVLLGPFLYSWGTNGNGELALGNTTNYSSPKQVGSFSIWESISRGTSFYTAIKTDGTLWSWGINAQGQLGLGNTTSYSSPKQVGSLTTWYKVSSGSDFTIAIKTNGTMWSWGQNRSDAGQLGLGNITYYSSPKQVGALTTWLRISCGRYHALATKTDGTLWAWGGNYQGAVGDGTSTNRSSPVQVGSLTTWATVSGGEYYSAATKTDGTIWMWGLNDYGQLGIGNTTYSYSSPKQVGALTTWASVNAGTYYSTAIKTDGTLWTWGRNLYGVLGLGNTTDYSSPKQVGALTTWLSIAPGSRRTHSVIVKTDGTLWTWGLNNVGQLGLNDRTNRSSPVQVGSSNSWSSVSAGNSSTLAIQN